MQPSKNGFMYVLDAKTRQADQRRCLHRSELGHGRRHEDRPPERGAGRAYYRDEPWNLAPGVQGGHSWHPNAFSPLTGLVYIPAWEAYSTLAGIDPRQERRLPSVFSLGISMGAQLAPGQAPAATTAGV